MPVKLQLNKTNRLGLDLLFNCLINLLCFELPKGQRRLVNSTLVNHLQIVSSTTLDSNIISHRTRIKLVQFTYCI